MGTIAHLMHKQVLLDLARVVPRGCDETEPLRRHGDDCMGKKRPNCFICALESPLWLLLSPDRDLLRPPAGRGPTLVALNHLTVPLSLWLPSSGCSAGASAVGTGACSVGSSAIVCAGLAPPI
jgi:hypothetical protein